MEPVTCPECDTVEWRCVERGRYDEYLYLTTGGNFGDTTQWLDRDEYDTERDSWECVNGHEAPEELQDELEERVMNA